MSSKNPEDKTDLFIRYNSLISLKLLSDHYHLHSKYIIRMENLEQTLLLKLCESPLLEYSDLKESFFYIRDIDECLSIYGKKKTDEPLNAQYMGQTNNLREEAILKFNDKFFLQHMMSKKFISIEKLQGNDNYSLKLVVEAEKATKFAFKMINETRSSIESLTFNNIVYLSVYNKEKGQDYYINHSSFEKIIVEKTEEESNNTYNEVELLGKKKKGKPKSVYSDLCLSNSANDKFSIINQSWYISKNEYLYSGQLINIIFSDINNTDKKKIMMLSAKGIKVEKKFEEIIGIKEEIREDIDGMLRDNNQKYMEFHGTTDRIEEKLNSFSSINIKGIEYTNNLFEHVVNNSFWVIEKESMRSGESFEREPIKLGDEVRIKNPLLGLYLRIKKKDKDQKNNSDLIENNNIVGNILSAKNVNNINTTVNNNAEEDEYELELVNREALEEYYHQYNFKFFHYNANEENKKNMIADGKYVLKSVFKEISDNSDKNINKKKIFDFKEADSYFEPISISIKNEDSLNIKIEDDYILDIKKIDINEGNQVIYIQNIISELDYILKSYKKKKTSSNSVIKKITQYINFFMEYLLNIEYTFKDDNYEINYPIFERQLLLDKFNVLETILEIINYFLPTVKDMKVRDSSFVKKKSKNTNIYSSNRVNENEKIKESLISYQTNDLWEKDTAVSNMKSMLKLILKFLVHLSDNNEDIKLKIFIVLFTILEFSEYIYTKDKSTLLDFIFEILNDSESLQECILTGKLKQIKNSNQLLSIDKILSYIETTFNYLYYYKKLINLNKIRYKSEEIKEKIKLHIKKVQKEFNNKRKLKNGEIKSNKKSSNNYKYIIYSALRTIEIAAKNQIKDLTKYLEEKQEEKNQNNNMNFKRGKTNLLQKDSKFNFNKKNTKKVNFDINIIQEDNASVNSNKIKTQKKIDLNENKENINKYNYEENNYEAESNDYLNNRSLSPIKSKQSGILNKTSLKKSILNSSIKNSTLIGKEKTFDISENNKNQENDLSNLYSDKNDDDFEAFAEKKISDLKIVLRFIKYFKSIKFNKILFLKDEFFRNIFGKDIKEEFLENNLSLLINGASNTINFINGVEFNSNSFLGAVLPFRLYNMFFPTLDDKLENFETSNILKTKEEIPISEEEDSESEDDEKIDDNKQINQKQAYKSNISLRKSNKIDEDEIEEDENEDINSSNKNYNNNLKSFRFDESSESDNENNYNIKESPFKKRISKMLNLSQMKNSNKDKDSLYSNKSKNVEEKKEDVKKNLRSTLKHKTVSIASKTVLFDSKKLLSDEPKKSEYQKIFEKCKEYDQEISKNIYILYCIYFFCVNEFIEIVYKTFTIIFNYCINYDYFSNINSVNLGLDYIKQSLLPRVIFINNNLFKVIYDKIKINPTLLSDIFNIENFNVFDYKNEYVNILEHDNDNDDNNYLNNKKTIFNRGSGNDLINKDNKFLFNGNEFAKLKVLTNEEYILLDFLIYYCKKNDQINYLFQKIEFFKKLKSLINKISPIENEDNRNDRNDRNDKKRLNKKLKKVINLAKIMSKTKKENNEENKIKTEFRELLINLIRKRSDILILYEKLFDIKNQFLYSNKNALISSNLDDYGIGKQADFMIKLLKQYEIDNYFNKIIYLEIKNNNEDNSFEKLTNVQEVFKEIEGEIQKIKEKNEINSYREDLSALIDPAFTPRKINQNKNNENHYLKINNKLQSISEKNLSNIFAIKEAIQKEGGVKLIEMLIKENENFFEKIGFANSLKLMVEFIEKYDDEENRTINNNDQNEDRSILKLKFCKEILRVFIEVKNVFPKFKKLVPEQFDIYTKMIIKSLECIKNFKKRENNNDGEEEKLFLCICYYSSESLLFLLKYCKKQIKDIREIIEKIANILKDIYDKCKNIKNKIIFQLFYNYLITRILILLNTFEFEESFIKKIYDKEYMKKRLIECINDLQKIELNSNVVEVNEEYENEDDGEEAEESEKNKDKDYLKGKKIAENYNDENEKNDWKEELYVTRGKNTDSSNEEKNLDDNNIGKNIKDINNNSNGGFDLNCNKDNILWEDDDGDEKEKLSFLLLFSSSYIIYLIDNKNIDKIISFLNFDDLNENNNIDNIYFEEKKNDSSIPDPKNNSFVNPRSTNVFRQRQLLDENHSSNNLNNNNNNLDNNKQKKKSINNISLLTKNNKLFNEISNHENKLNFEVILFESISGSSNSIKKKNYEIPIKKNKSENDYSNESNHNSNKEEEMKNDEIISKNYQRLITFYYYESKTLDIILLEKIFKDIEIQKNLKYYCTNSFTKEEDKPSEKSKLLNQLLDLQNRFNSITYQNKEYGLLKEQFKRNDMEKFIKKLLKHFNEDDLLSIEKMQDYIYNIMNEIYPHESLYNDNQTEMIVSLIEKLQNLENDIQNELLHPDNEASRKEKNIIDKSIRELQQIDLNKFFNSLIYLYPKNSKKICLIFYRIAFQLLHLQCSSFFKNDKKNSNEIQMILFSVLNGIILLFKRENNHQLIESKNIFFIMVNSINLLLEKIQETHIFIFKNNKLIQEFFHKLDFVLKHLSKDFDKIYNFMKSPESQQITDKYKKMENSLNDLIKFITTLIGFKKIDKNILTKEINDFSKDIVEKIIKLIFILLKKNQVTSFQSIDLLLNFIYYFIDGPDIDNLNTLFNSGYFVLVSNIIQKIDYYNLFLSNINKENPHVIIDNVIEIECRIVKIFFIYYNICHHENNENANRNLRNWYDENLQSIKNKLKKIYYLSKKEMENREYDIDRMLLSLKEVDSYTDKELRERAANFEFNLENIDNLNDENKIFDNSNENDESNKEQNENKKNKNLNNNKENNNIKTKKFKENENNKNKDYCLIKFDLMLIYYILYSYHQDSINVEYLSVPPKSNLLRIIIGFIIECWLFIKGIIISPYYLITYIYKHATIKQKNNIELLQELSDIDKKCLSVDENEMFRFLTNKIKCVEVTLNNIRYKIYFPLLNKAKFIQDNSEIYLKVDNSQLSSYVNNILSSYDRINALATQDYKINKLTEFPLIRIIFKYNNLYSILLILIGFTINILIMLSYNAYNSNCNDKDYQKYSLSRSSRRLYCPHLLYKEKRSEKQMMIIFNYLGSILLTLQCILFLGYILKKFSQSWLLFKNDYKKKVLLNQRSKSNFSYFCYFLPEIFLIIFVDFQTIYYLLSIFFIILGIKIHPFFFAFTLLELVNRVEVMQTVLKAMYIPLANILINLLMFIMLEYAFALFALVNYRTHFPIPNDSYNFLRTFMRMLDQTFKQDGGIGTYLDQTLDPDYEPYVAKAYAGGRFFFDLLFFLSVNTLIFQMFLSTIIDYFNTTKEKKEEFQKLYESKCLICEQDRENLEKLYSNLKNAFELHINHFHSIIDYIAYLLYLQASNLRDPIIDENVWKLHLSNNLKYLPKKKKT